MPKIIIQNIEEFKEVVYRKFAAAGFLIVKEIQDQIMSMDLFQTGDFRNSIQSKFENGVLTIESTVPYAYYLEFGTTRHFIKPVNKKALSWEKGAKRFYSKGHWVEGIKAYAPFRKVILNPTIMANVFKKVGEAKLV